MCFTTMKKLKIITLFVAFISAAFVQANTPSSLSATVLNVPKGPGTVTGLGESFQVLMSTGTSSTGFSVGVPPGRNGLTPQVSIDYNSGYGNADVGLGWRLSSLYLKRQTDDGLPNYYDAWQGNANVSWADGIVDQDGSELVYLGENFFRSEFESSFTEYKKLNSGWQARLPNGSMIYFGITSNSRVEDGDRIYQWLIDSVVDVQGNIIKYSYKVGGHGKEKYLLNITYNEYADNKNTIHFNYEDRPDIKVDYKPAFKLQHNKRLESIETFINNERIRKYKINYQPIDLWLTQSLIKDISVYAKTDDVLLTSSAYSYTSSTPTILGVKNLKTQKSIAFNNRDVQFLDVNNDALPDLIDTRFSSDVLYLNQGLNRETWSEPQAMSESDTGQITNKNVTWADVNGDGKTDMVKNVGTDTYFYSLNTTGNRWEKIKDLDNTQLEIGAEGVAMFDINNDKRIDIFKATPTAGKGKYYAQLNLESGLSRLIEIPSESDVSGFCLCDQGSFLSDMNGDGLQDLVNVRNNSLYYFPSMGIEGYGNKVVFDTPPSVTGTSGEFQLLDMNADGISDVIYILDSHYYVWLNKGVTQSGLKGSLSQRYRFKTPNIVYSANRVETGDFNANGSNDILWYSPNNSVNTYVYMDLYPSEQPNQLKTITNGIGAKTTLYYGALVDEMIRDREAGTPWEQGVPIGMQILKRIEVEDGISDVVQTTNINYHNGYYHAQEKEFRGFEKSEEIISGDASMPSLHTYSQYHLGKSNEVLKGLPKSIDVQDASGNSFYTETQTWNAKKLLDGASGESRSVYFAELAQVKKSITEKSNGDAVTLITNFEYDNYGNTTKITEHGRSDRTWQDERITQNRFSSENATSLENWMLNYPIETIVTDGSGTALSKQQWFYDDESFTASDLGAVTKGNLTLNKAWINPSDDTSAINLVRQKFYDNGNVSDIYGPLWGEGPAGHHTSIVYDETFNAFPVSETIHSDGTSFTATSRYNFDYGTMASFTDFNDHTTSFGYDDFGRITRIVKQGDSEAAPTVTYDYKINQSVDGGVVNWVETKQRENIGGGTLDSRIFYDGLGRTLLEKTEGSNTGQVVVGSQSVYSQRGSAFKNYLPYYSSTMAFNKTESGNAYTEQSFDELGRPLKAWTPFNEDNSRSYSEWSYQPLVQLISDNEQTDSSSDHFGSYKRLTFDGLLNDEGQGRLVKVDEVVKLDENGEESSITAWSTLYEYDVLGNFTKLTDAQGNVRTMQYDGLGRNYFYNDPNRGYFWQAFDAASNVIASRDANGQEIHYEFDGANRVKAEYHLTPTTSDAIVNSYWQPVQNFSALTPAVTFEYDRINGATSGASLGRIVKVNDAAGYSQYKFDNRGRVIEQGRQITGHGIHSSVYTSKRSYDSSDRLTRYEYPDTTYLTYDYDNRGSLNSISGVVDNIEYTAAGQQSKREYSNGVEIDYTYDSQQRLKTLLATRTIDSAQLQNLTYEFDALTNIKSITDGRSDTELHTIATEIDLDSAQAQELKQSFTYKYDDLYRLQEAESNLVKYQYQYDLIGNVKQKTVIDSTANTLVTHLRYGNSQTDENYGSFDRVGRVKNEVAGPHAVTYTNGQDSYFYDDNGNLSQDGNLHYQWDHNNRLIKVSTQAPASSRAQ